MKLCVRPIFFICLVFLYPPAYVRVVWNGLAKYLNSQALGSGKGELYPRYTRDLWVRDKNFVHRQVSESPDESNSVFCFC